MISIFDYLDYRKYLKDLFNLQKSESSHISYRYMEKRLGIDASYYRKILIGEKHLSESQIEPLINYLQLEQKEKEYFTELIRYSKATDESHVARSLQSLASFRGATRATLEMEKYRIFRQWQNTAIRELISIAPISSVDEILPSYFISPLTIQEIKQSFALLEKLHLITKESGYYRCTERFITTESRLKSEAVRSFQKTMMEKAISAIDKIPPDRRNISSLTVSCSLSTRDEIFEIIERTRNEILHLVEKDGSPEDVFQVNFQVFPLTNRGDR